MCFKLPVLPAKSFIVEAEAEAAEAAPWRAGAEAAEASPWSAAAEAVEASHSKAAEAEAAPQPER